LSPQAASSAAEQSAVTVVERMVFFMRDFPVLRPAPLPFAEDNILPANDIRLQ
jgi:hypothetical protein